MGHTRVPVVPAPRRTASAAGRPTGIDTCRSGTESGSWANPPHGSGSRCRRCRRPTGAGMTAGWPRGTPPSAPIDRLCDRPTDG